MAAINLDIGGNTRRLDRDIQKTVNRVYNINLKTKGDQPLGRITGQVNEFNKSLDASNARVIAFGASAGIIFGVQRAFSALVGATIEVQKSLQDINVILNVSAQNLQKFGGELFNIAKNTGQSFQEVAKAATEFSRQGLGVEETLKRTNEALILSRLSGLDAAKSVEALTAAVNSYASQAITASEVVNKFANVDAAFAVSSADLAEALARVGSSAAQSGVSLNELIAIVTSAQQTTARGGAVIGNSFKTIFTRLQRGKVVDLLGTLGISDTNASGELKSTIQLLQDLGTVYDTLGARQQAAVAEQVGGVFQINILKAALADLGKEYSIYSSALDVAAGTTDQAIRRNEELNKTYAAQLNALQENARQIASAAGERLLGPSIDRLVGGSNTLLGGINESDGQGFGAVLGKGILDGLGQFIAGPGLALIGGVLLKLFRDLGKFATGSVQQLLGLNTAATQQKDLQASISQILAKNPQLLELALKGEQGLNTAANSLLASLQKQTVELQKQAVVAAQLSKAFISQAGVRVAGGIPVAPASKPGKAAGYIPNFAEVSQAIELGAPSSVQSVSGVGKIGGKSFEANNKEFQIPDFGGTGETAVIPKYGGGIKEATKMIARGESGSVLDKSDRNRARGFVPNFAKTAKTDGSSKVFGAGRVFENAIGLAAGLQKEYFEDNFILDYEPNVWAGKQDVKKILGVNEKTNYGDAKLSTEGSNLTSYLSKIIRYDSGLRGSKKVGNIKDFNQKFGLRKQLDINKRGPNNINLSQPAGGSIIVPGNKKGDGLKDRKVNIKARLSELKKVNSSIANVFANPNNKYGIDPKSKSDPIFSLNNVLIDTTEVLRSGTFGAQSREERERKARNIASRFTPKSFSSGFIPNFAKQKIASKNAIDLGNLDTIPNELGNKVVSLIYPGLSDGYSLRPATANYLKQDYRGNIPVAGINQKTLKSQLPDLDQNLGNLLVREANQFGQSLGGTNFLNSAKDLPNFGAAQGAVGVAFEGGVQTLLQQKVGRKQNAGIDFRNITPRLRSIFNGAPGMYDAKSSPELTNEVFKKLLNETRPGATVQKSSGQAGKDYLAKRSAAVAELKKEGVTGSVAIRQALKDRFGIVGKAAGYIPNFAAPLVRAVDDKELRMMLSKFGKGWAFQNKSFDQSAMEYFGGSGTYMWDALSRPGEQISDRRAYKQNIGRAKNWSSARKQSSWLVRYNRSKLKDSELLPDMETGGASVYGLPLSKDQIVWPIKQSDGSGRIFEKDIPAFLSGQVNDAIKREKSAGIPSSQIYLAQEKALTGANPMGIGVFNKTHEPTAGKRREQMKRKGFARGFVPNFAIEDPDTQTASLGASIGAITAQLSGLAFAFAFSGGQFKEALTNLTTTAKQNAAEQRKILADNIKKQRAEARKTSSLGSGATQIIGADGRSTGKMTSPNRQAAVASAGANFQPAIAAAPSKDPKIGFGGKAMAFGGANALGLSIAAPILGETIKNIAGQETSTRRGIGETGSAIGQIGSFAATGGLIGGAPGAAIGGAIGALLSIPSAIDAFTSELPDLAAAAKKASQDLTKFSDTSQRILTTSSSLSQLREDNGSSDKIEKVQNEFIKAISELTPAEQARVESSIKIGKLEEELAQITQERIEQEKSKSKALALGELSERTFLEKVFAGGGLSDRKTTKGEQEQGTIKGIFKDFFAGQTQKDTLENFKGAVGAITELENLRGEVEKNVIDPNSLIDAFDTSRKQLGIKGSGQLFSEDYSKPLQDILENTIPKADPTNLDEVEARSQQIQRLVDIAAIDFDSFVLLTSDLIETLKREPGSIEKGFKINEERDRADKLAAEARKTEKAAIDATISSIQKNIAIQNLWKSAIENLGENIKAFSENLRIEQELTQPRDTLEKLIGADKSPVRRLAAQEGLAGIQEGQRSTLSSAGIGFKENVRGILEKPFQDNIDKLVADLSKTGSGFAGTSEEKIRTESKEVQDKSKEQFGLLNQTMKQVEGYMAQFVSGQISTQQLLEASKSELAGVGIDVSRGSQASDAIEKAVTELEVKTLQEEVRAFQQRAKLASETKQAILQSRIDQAIGTFGGFEGFMNRPEEEENYIQRIGGDLKNVEEMRSSPTFRYNNKESIEEQKKQAPELGRSFAKIYKELIDQSGGGFRDVIQSAIDAGPQLTGAESRSGRAGASTQGGFDDIVRGRKQDLEQQLKLAEDQIKVTTDPALKRDLEGFVSSIRNMPGGTQGIAQLQTQKELGVARQGDFAKVYGKYENEALNRLKDISPELAASLENAISLSDDPLVAEAQLQTSLQGELVGYMAPIQAAILKIANLSGGSVTDTGVLPTQIEAYKPKLTEEQQAKADETKKQQEATTKKEADAKIQKAQQAAMPKDNRTISEIEAETRAKRDQKYLQSPVAPMNRTTGKQFESVEEVDAEMTKALALGAVNPEQKEYYKVLENFKQNLDPTGGTDPNRNSGRDGRNYMFNLDDRSRPVDPNSPLEIEKRTAAARDQRMRGITNPQQILGQNLSLGPNIPTGEIDLQSQIQSQLKPLGDIGTNLRPLSQINNDVTRSSYDMDVKRKGLYEGDLGKEVERRKLAENPLLTLSPQKITTQGPQPIEQSFTQQEAAFSNNTSALTALAGGIESLNSTLANFGSNAPNLNNIPGAQPAGAQPAGAQPNITTTTSAPVSVTVQAQGGGDIATAVGAAVQNAIPTIVEKVRIALGEKVPPTAPKPLTTNPKFGAGKRADGGFLL